jgi:hypothetical protein
MTPEQEAELIEKMATEICYAWFAGKNIDYGGPKKYWKGVVEAKKEVYRREARAALSIAAPILRDEALEEAAAKAESTWLETTFVGKAAIHAGENMCRIVAAAIRSLKTKDQPE